MTRQETLDALNKNNYVITINKRAFLHMNNLTHVSFHYDFILLLICIFSHDLAILNLIKT